MKKQIFISYDREADVMYLSFGKPVIDVGEEIQTGVFAHYDAKTAELVGLTIINFSKKCHKEPKGIAIPVLATGK